MIDCVNDVKDGKFGKVCAKLKLSVGEAIEELVQNPRIKETIVIIAQNNGWRFIFLECSSHCDCINFCLTPRCRSIFSLFYLYAFREILSSVLLATEMNGMLKGLRV